VCLTCGLSVPVLPSIGCIVSDLRELNEMNFARSDPKAEQRFAEFKAWFETRLDKKLADLKIDARFATVEADIQVLRADLRADLKSMEAKLVKWMFLFWAGTAFAGLLFR
jgi:hypothetical protein